MLGNTISYDVLMSFVVLVVSTSAGTGWAGGGAASAANGTWGGGSVVRAASSISVALDGGGVGGPVIFGFQTDQ